MPTWPDLDASLDYDAGWRQRFFEADGSGRCRPVARPVFHHVAEAVFGVDGAVERLVSGSAEAVYLQAEGVGVVLARARHAGAEGYGGDTVVATILPAGRRPMTAADLRAAVVEGPQRVLGADPRSWPAAAPCC